MLVREVMLKVSVSFQQVIVSRETEGSSYPTVEKMLRRLSPEDGHTGVSLHHTTRQNTKVEPLSKDTLEIMTPL